MAKRCHGNYIGQMMVSVHLDIRRIRWQETIALRKEVLWPNESEEYCHVAGDENAWHYGGYLMNELVSVASVFRDKKSARLRKFATSNTYQGKGIGTQMLEHILIELTKNEDEEFWCDARESAMGFYQRFGMMSEGCRFYKEAVPYFKMTLPLK